jgi:hypothetical protein
MPTATEIAESNRVSQSLASTASRGRAIVANAAQAISDRETKIVEQLCAGRSIEQVARSYNLTPIEVQTVAERQMVALQMELARPENKEVAIGIELSKIDRLAAFWEFDATYGKNLEAAKFMLNCLQERAKRLDLYPAQQTESKNVNVNLTAQDLIRAGKSQAEKFIQDRLKKTAQAIEVSQLPEQQSQTPIGTTIIEAETQPVTK